MNHPAKIGLLTNDLLSSSANSISGFGLKPVQLRKIIPGTTKTLIPEGLCDNKISTSTMKLFRITKMCSMTKSTCFSLLL